MCLGSSQSVRFSAGEASISYFVITMDNILRELEGLSRHELVWSNTCLAGPLRALPPASVQHLGLQREVTTAALSAGPALTFSCSVLLGYEAGQPISRLWQMWIFQGMSIGVLPMSSHGAMVNYAG